MTDINKHLHLFTSVEDVLPHNEPNMYLVIKSGCNFLTWCFWDYPYFNGSPQKNEAMRFDFNSVTHWLDLSNLTTKAKTEEMIRGAFQKGKINSNLQLLFG